MRTLVRVFGWALYSDSMDCLARCYNVWYGKEVQCGKGTGSPTRSRLGDLQQAVSNRLKLTLSTLDDDIVGTLVECGK